MSKAASWHPIPVRLVDEVMPRLRDTELRVLLIVLRQTWGWTADQAEAGKSKAEKSKAEKTETGQKRRTKMEYPNTEYPKTKRRDWLSHSQLCRRTGRGSDAVSAAVASLTASGLIVVEDAAGRPLPTPEERRRCLGRLYFRPGDMWRDWNMRAGEGA